MLYVFPLERLVCKCYYVRVSVAPMDYFVYYYYYLRVLTLMLLLKL